MAGAVFAAELLRAARGRFAHVARWAYGGWLAAVLYAAFTGYTAVGLPGATADFAHELVDWLVWQQTVLVLVVTPAFAAGAVTDEKVRGTLEPLFLAQLRPASIILGKLLARVALGFAWSLAAWPVLAFLGVYGGVTPVFFVALASVTVLSLAGTGALSLLVSVWARTTRDAVVGSYVLLAVGAAGVVAARFAGPRWAPLAAFDPNYVLDAARDQPDNAAVAMRLRLAALSWGSLAVLCTAIAAWRLRPAFVRQQQARRRAAVVRWLEYRAPVTDEPVYWRERFTGRGPPRWLGQLLAGAAGAGAVAALASGSASAAQLADDCISLQCVAIWLASLAVGVRAAGTVVAERDRRTWDDLAATPLHFGAIVEQKTEATVNSVRSYYLAFLAAGCMVLSLDEVRPALGLTAIGIAAMLTAAAVAAVDLFEHPLTPFALVGLALAASFNSAAAALLAAIGPLFAEVAMRFMAAVGTWFSVRSRSGWLSLLGTVALGYFVASTVLAISTPLGCLSCCFLGLLFGVIDATAGLGLAAVVGPQLLPVFWACGSALGLWWAGRRIHDWAVGYLDKTERVPGNFVRLIDLDQPYRPPRDGPPVRPAGPGDLPQVMRRATNPFA